MKKLNGECLCGAIRFTVEDAFRYALNCHCSQCRRATGAAFKPFAGIERSRLKVVAGTRKILRYGEPRTHDVHCGRCGSFLYSVVRDGKYVHVNLGSLRGTPSLRPSAHIYVGSKAAWYEIADDLPQHETLPE
jgi:hypothetical protein